MITLDLVRNRIILLVVIFCYLQRSTATKVRSTQKISTTSRDDEKNELSSIEEVSGSDPPETTTVDNVEQESLADAEDPANQTKRNFDRINEIFKPFLSLPLFPFHIPDLKRSIFHLNSSDREGEEPDGNRSRRKSKPFFFIDFTFDIQIPARNETEEEKALEKFLGETGQESKAGENVFDDVWSFSDDPPSPPQDLDEFLPRPDWFLFDFPFRNGKQSGRQIRDKRDKSKSKVGEFMNIIESAISRTKREMERKMPIWEFMRLKEKTDRTIGKREDFLLPEAENSGQNSDFNRNSGNTTKSNPIGLVPAKSPVLLGKVVKIKEVHFRNDFPKGNLKKKRKQRRSLSTSGTRENPGFREKSGRDAVGGKRGRAVRGTQDAKIMDLMAQWDRRMMEDQVEGKTPKVKTLETYNEMMPNDVQPSPKKLGKFKYVRQSTGKREMSKDAAGFEMLKSQQSPLRRKRQGNNDGSGNWENVTASKDEVSRNITKVLGQFFSMVRKLEESKNSYQGIEMNEVIWPELGQAHGSRVDVKDAKKKGRAERQVEQEEKERTAPVADLNFLFMTVTLPTTLAFTLLLLICFFNLRPKSWLCQKVFQNRNVYIVEDGIGKPKDNLVDEEEPSHNKESYDRKKGNHTDLIHSDMEYGSGDDIESGLEKRQKREMTA